MCDFGGLFTYDFSFVLGVFADFLISYLPIFYVDDGEINTFFPVAFTMEGFGLMGWSTWQFATLSTTTQTIAINEISKNVTTQFRLDLRMSKIVETKYHLKWGQGYQNLICLS
jgi:hypothetical protein